jgi:hypothetical protein
VTQGFYSEDSGLLLGYAQVETITCTKDKTGKMNNTGPLMVQRP